LPAFLNENLWTEPVRPESGVELDWDGNNGFKRMAKTFKRGDHVEWNSEAGRVRGTIIKRVVSDTRIKGYVHHASKDDPQYLIKSDKTDHIAIHKGRALKRIRTPPTRRRRSKKHN
jgi:hypothetical protein